LIQGRDESCIESISNTQKSFFEIPRSHLVGLMWALSMGLSRSATYAAWKIGQHVCHPDFVFMMLLRSMCIMGFSYLYGKSHGISFQNMGKNVFDELSPESKKAIIYRCIFGIVGALCSYLCILNLPMSIS